MKVRQFAMRTVGAATLAASAVAGGAGVAAASPAPAPALYASYLNGPSVLTLGQNNWCNGIIDAFLETDPAKPGHATVVYNSRGMHGVGPEWVKNPVCNVTAQFTHYDGVFPFVHTVEHPVQFGEQPATRRFDVALGSGVIYYGISAPAIDMTFTKFYPQYSYPSAAFAIIP